MRSRVAGHDVPAPIFTTERQFITVSAPLGRRSSARANAPSAAAPQRKKVKPAVRPPLGKHIFKSLSTPQLRESIMSDSEAQKRNKLGYQRISIACAHCRRRKIRCLLTDDENESRCQNCIRLKKECVFYPVDQQAAIDAKSEASNRTGGPSASSTVSSSPSQVDARSLEQQGHQFGSGFPGIPSHGPRSFQGIPIIPNLTIPPPGEFSHPEHGFRGGEVGVAWSPQDFGPPSSAMSMSDPVQMQQHFARYSQQNMTVDTAPFPGPIDQSSQNLEHFGYASASMVPQQWQHPPQPQHQQPARSMSYPNNYAHQMYSPSLQQGPPVSPYIQSPPSQQHPPDPRMFTMAPGQGGFVGVPAPYMITPDQRNSSIPNPSPFHAPQAQQIWYSGAVPYTSAGQEPRTLPSQHDDGE